MADLTLQELRRLRVGAHLLDGRGAGDVATVVAHLGALQAQDRAASLWSLGIRAGLDVTAVEEAVATRSVVRTWPMRGTLHWVPSQDARWMCRTLSAQAVRAAARLREQRGLSDEVLARAAAVLEDVLARGPVARPEVYAAWERAGIPTAGQRGYLLLVLLAQDGLVVQAGLEGKQPTFALLDQWVRRSLDVDREEGLAMAVERFVRGHGPVHEKDVAGWYGGTLREVRATVAALGERITTVTHEGATLLVHAEAEPAAGPLTVLLPAFDEYLLGIKDRSHVLAPPQARAVVPGGNGVFQSTLLVDGEVVGTWRRTEHADHVGVTITPFEPLPARTREAIEGAAAAYGDFLGLPVRVEPA